MKTNITIGHITLVTLLLTSLWTASLAPARAESDGGWDKEIVDGQSAYAGRHPSLALDGAGQPHISYCGPSDLRYAAHDGAAWQIETVEGGGCAYTSLALDGAGQPHVSYSAWTAGDLKYAHRDGAQWQTETVDEEGLVGEFSSLVLDRDGQPYIAYWDRTNNALKIAHLSQETWEIEVVDADVQMMATTARTPDRASAMVARTSLALDSEDQPHILYGDQATPPVLKYARREGGRWQIEEVRHGYIGLHGSLALDANDQPRVSYQENGLVYTIQDGGQWHMTTVDDGEGAGAQSDLALDGAGGPYIAYSASDQIGQSLRYAYLEGSTWQRETVTSVQQAAPRYADVSLVLDGDSRPHIAYHELGDYTLVYAVRGSGVGSAIYLPLLTHNY